MTHSLLPMMMAMMLMLLLLRTNLALLVVFRIENAHLLPLQLEQTVGVSQELWQG